MSSACFKTLEGLAGPKDGTSSSRIGECELSETKSKVSSSRIERAKTAISRNNFSTPVQHLLESGLLTKKRSFFDYGCGRGDDVAGLSGLGFRAAGWDPEFWPKNERTSAEIVNAGFVLNVIEDTAERRQALLSAWELTSRAMIVSVISRWHQPQGALSSYSDGSLTRKGTFQHYYEPGELKQYVDDLLGLDALPVSPFAVICFKDAETEQSYLAHSTNGRRNAVPVPMHPLRKTRLGLAIESFRDARPEAWDSIVERTTYYAIPPEDSEIGEYEELARAGVRAADLFATVVEAFGQEKWDAFVQLARNRYVARIALGFFRGTPRPKHFGTEDRKSIRVHFGTFDAAAIQARETLFGIGNPERVTASCKEAEIGIEDEQALYIHRSGVSYLDAILQTYIGVGRLFYGSLDTVDLFKIHKRSGKLTLLLYDNFDSETEPTLLTRIKIDFRERGSRCSCHRRSDLH